MFPLSSCAASQSGTLQLHIGLPKFPKLSSKFPGFPRNLRRFPESGENKLEIQILLTRILAKSGNLGNFATLGTWYSIM